MTAVTLSFVMARFAVTDKGAFENAGDLEHILNKKHTEDQKHL